MKPKPEPGPGMTVGGQVLWWGVSETIIKRLRAQGAPLHSPKELAEWRKTHKVPEAVAAKLDETEKPSAESELENDVDWEEFEKRVRSDDPKESMAQLAKARDFAAFKFEKAGRLNDTKKQEFYSKLLTRFEGAFHDAQLRGKRLGLDAGELLPRPEVERILWALAHWLLRSTDQHLDAITAKLTALSPGLSATPVRAVLEPELLSQRFLVPFAHAAKIQNGVGLPGWVVAKMRESAGDFLENGEKQFDEIT
jgi:DNA-binding transcriptional MerR regulator